jgi:TPP-dependent pyruvate/acetoin dehydrogenase alpha subunit
MWLNHSATTMPRQFSPMLGRMGCGSVLQSQQTSWFEGHSTTMGYRKSGEWEPDAAASPGGEKFSLISNDKLLALYKNLLKCREARQRSKSANGRPVTPPIHDAAMVGTAIDLEAGDVVCSLDLEVLASISEGSALEMLFSIFGHGRENGARGARKPGAPNGYNGTPFAHGLIGTALASKTARNGRVAVVYCNGKNPESLRETIHIATVHALPVIFVQQLNSGNGQETESRRAAKRKQVNDTPWYPNISVDTDDLVAVYRVAYESISRARLGRGPTLIECHTVRFPDGTRDTEGRQTGDSVQNMEHYLRAKGLDPSFESSSTAQRKNRPKQKV